MDCNLAATGVATLSRIAANDARDSLLRMLRDIRIAASLAVVLVVVVTGVAWFLLRRGEPAGRAGLATGVSIGGPFSLTDHTGKAVTDESYRGQVRLIYFGYTFCPDVCPTELANLSVALDALGPDIDKVQPLLISIDPERDTPEVLAEYAPLFHDKFVGLTGTAQQIEDIAKHYRVFYRRIEDPEYTYYLMDHTSFTYLMGPDGEFLNMFAYGTDPEELADAIRRKL